MKKAMTIAMVCGMACVMNAQTQTINPLDEVDAQVKAATIAGHNEVVEKALTHYHDIEGSYVGNNLDEMVGSQKVVYGLQLGLYAKGEYQNGLFHPEVGATAEYHFKRAMLAAEIGARRNSYTKYQGTEANKAFWGMSFGLEAAYAVWQTKDHHYKVSIGAYGNANLTGQHHAFEAHEESFDFEYENDFRARVFSGGALVRFDMAPGFQSTLRYAIKLKAGIGQDYEYNNHHESQFQCSATLVVGFNCHKTHHGKMNASTGRIISQY